MRRRDARPVRRAARKADRWKPRHRAPSRPNHLRSGSNKVRRTSNTSPSTADHEVGAGDRSTVLGARRADDKRLSHPQPRFVPPFRLVAQDGSLSFNR